MKTDEKKERLKKLYRLALSGVDGEKEQAKALLAKLLEKYAMTIHDIEDNAINEYQLEYHGADQRKILIQTIYKVTGHKDAFFSLYHTVTKEKSDFLLGVRCTAAQKVEIEFLFDFYIRLWEKECKAFLAAFIQKNQIFGIPKSDEERTIFSPEDIEKINALLDGLYDVTPHRQIVSTSRQIRSGA